MATPALVCATAEVALNRYLRLEPSALEACGRLAGKALSVQVADLGWTLVIEPNAGGVRVGAEIPQPADVQVSAPSLRLLRLGIATLGGGGPGKGLPAGLAVEGDTDLLMRFNAILTQVGFDPEELAAKLVGDAAAHRVVGGLKSLLGFGRHATTRFGEDAVEYLVEEREDLARAEDVADWMDQVDTLREDVDRLDARLARIEARAAAGSGT